eukprot:scaffold126489_cov48-Phaeocystis_antarctica.AAC.1
MGSASLGLCLGPASLGFFLGSSASLGLCLGSSASLGFEPPMEHTLPQLRSGAWACGEARDATQRLLRVRVRVRVRVRASARARARAGVQARGRVRARGRGRVGVRTQWSA